MPRVANRRAGAGPNRRGNFRTPRRRSGYPPIVTSVPCLLWVEADTLVQSGGFVDSWTDQSGYGHNLVPTGVATTRPAYEALGWNGTSPSVLFDGIDDRLAANLFGPATPIGLSFVMAAECPTLVSGDRILYWVTGANAHQIQQRLTALRYAAAGGGLRDSSGTARGVYMTTSTGITTNLQWYFNGVATTNTLTANFPPDPGVGDQFLIGSTNSPSAFANVRIGAAMVFRGQLSAADIAAIQARLASKGYAA